MISLQIWFYPRNRNAIKLPPLPAQLLFPTSSLVLFSYFFEMATLTHPSGPGCMYDWTVFPAVLRLESIYGECHSKGVDVCSVRSVVFSFLFSRQPEVCAIIKGLPAMAATWQSPELPVASCQFGRQRQLARESLDMLPSG